MPCAASGDNAAAQAASAALQGAQHARAAAASALQAAEREQRSLAELLADPARQAEHDRQQQALAAAEAERAACGQRSEALAAQLAAARPELLAQDAQRLAASAQALEREHDERDRQITALSARLQAAGAAGLDEQLAQAQRRAVAAERRAGELQRRADALSLLAERMAAQRRAVTARLQAPLQRRMDHYLGLLLPPDAQGRPRRLQVDALLRPQRLERAAAGAAAHDAGGEPVAQLSFGAREQIGVVGRLAYADLLRQAGRPTLLILDDALVHADRVRLDAMKRVLFDAAHRHQLLLFTCHPDRWHDVGGSRRALPAPG